MPLPGSWISATYLLNNKFKASIYLKKRWICLDKKRLFYFPYIKILLGHGNSGGLSVTLTCKVVVYHRIDRVIAFSPVVGIGTPHTLTLPFGSSGGYTLASGRGGGGVLIRTRGHRLWYSRYICTLCGVLSSWAGRATILIVPLHFWLSGVNTEY